MIAGVVCCRFAIPESDAARHVPVRRDGDAARDGGLRLRHHLIRHQVRIHNWCVSYSSFFRFQCVFSAPCLSLFHGFSWQLGKQPLLSVIHEKKSGERYAEKGRVLRDGNRWVSTIFAEAQLLQGRNTRDIFFFVIKPATHPGRAHRHALPNDICVCIVG